MGAAAVPAVAMIAGEMLNAGNQQTMNSFSGGGTTDPRTMLNNFLGQYNDLKNRIANQKYDFSDAVVQAPHGYSGGGLPMRIGLDPSLHDPIFDKGGPSTLSGITPNAGSGVDTKSVPYMDPNDPLGGFYPHTPGELDPTAPNPATPGTSPSNPVRRRV